MEVVRVLNSRRRLNGPVAVDGVEDLDEGLCGGPRRSRGRAQRKMSEKTGR